MADNLTTTDKAKARRERLGQDTARQRIRRRAARASSGRMVRILRIALPLAAFAILTVVLAWPDMEVPVKTLAQTETELPKGFQNELVNPRFESSDDSGRPYSITASRALQKGESLNALKLEDLKASMKLGDDTMLEGQAITGDYDETAGTLLLDGGVTLNHSTGIDFQTEQISVDLTTRAAETRTDVQGSGQGGTLHSKGMKILDNGDRIDFFGPVKMTFTPENDEE